MIGILHSFTAIDGSTESPDLVIICLSLVEFDSEIIDLVFDAVDGMETDIFASLPHLITVSGFNPKSLPQTKYFTWTSHPRALFKLTQAHLDLRVLSESENYCCYPRSYLS